MATTVDNSKRDAKIVELSKTVSLENLASRFGLTKSRIIQIKEKAHAQVSLPS